MPGGAFSRDLIGYMNDKQGGTITTFFYEEIFGVRDRVHWLVHLKAPNDYSRSLDTVDDDEEFRGRCCVAARVASEYRT